MELIKLKSHNTMQWAHIPPNLKNALSSMWRDIENGKSHFYFSISMRQKWSYKLKTQLRYVQTNKQIRLELDKLHIHALKTNIQK